MSKMVAFGSLLRKAKKSVILIALAGALAIVAGCGGGSGGDNPPSSPTITSVTASCSPSSVTTNQTSACAATVSGTGSYSSAVTWSVSPTSIGSVSNTGVFTPSSAGTATITATSTQDNTKSGSASVVVSVQPSITSVSVACFASAIFTTQTSTCTPSVAGAGQFGTGVTWSVSPSSIGTVSNSGLFTPTATGVATISATSTQDPTKSGSATVTVTDSKAFQHGALLTSPILYPDQLTTTVTVSVWLPDANLNTSSVTAYETDQHGKPIRSEGLLNDAGINGDQAAGDKVYTIQFTISDAQPATHYYAVSFSSSTTGLTYWSDVDTTMSVPTMSVTDGASYAQSIEDSMTRIANATASFKALQPTPSKPINQTALNAYLAAMTSVVGNIQLLNTFDKINPFSVHSQMTGMALDLRPVEEDASSFWSAIPPLASFLGTANQLQAEEAAFTGPSFNPNDPAVAPIMAWLQQNPDEEAICSPDLQDDANCRVYIWADFSETPSAGLLDATRNTAASVGISEATGIGDGLVEDGTGDLLSQIPDLSPLQQWAVGQDIGSGYDYFVDNTVAPDGHQMLLFGGLSNNQTTPLPNGTNNIILADGTSQTGLSSSAPEITTLSPSFLPVGSLPQTLTISGADFTANSSVTFNGIVHTSKFVSANQLTIPLTASDLASPGQYAVTVMNPAAVGNISASSSFTVIGSQTLGSVAAGTTPTAIALNPTTNMIYVINQGSNDITAINGADNTTTTIPLGYRPLTLAINSLTNTIYVAGYSASLTAINGVTGSTTSIPLGLTSTSEPIYGLGVNSRTNMIYLVDYQGDALIIDGVDYKATALPETSSGTVSRFLAVNEIANKIYIPRIPGSGLPSSLSILDGNTLTSTSTTLGPDPIAMAVNTATNQIFVVDDTSDSLTLIDGGTGSATTLPSIGPLLKAVAVDPTTNLAYIAAYGSCEAYCPGGYAIVNPSTQTNTYVSVPNGGNFAAVAVNAKSNEIYFVNNYWESSTVDGTVTILDGNTDLTDTVSVGLNPVAIAVNEVTGRVYVVNMASNNVTVIGPQ